MLIGLVAAAVALEGIFPSPPPQPRQRIVYRDRYIEPAEQDIPSYGTDTGERNPHANESEHDYYGTPDPK